MGGRPVEVVREERAVAIRKCRKVGIFALDPAASEEKLWGKHKKAKINLKFPERVIEAFITNDEWLIYKSDAVIVMTGDTPSDGTWWEMVFAKLIGKPVIMIAPMRARGQLIGWSNVKLRGNVVSDMDEALALIKRKYMKAYKDHKEFWETAIRNGELSFAETDRKSKKRSRRKTKRRKRSPVRAKKRKSNKRR